MADPKGYKLFVNLGASQTRRRLKGFGHGVRKVQTGGRNQAVIIHTATGRHLAELEAKFDDVGCSSSAGELGEPIANLRNLGPTSVDWLRDVGIATRAQLENVGPVLAFQMVRRRQPKATLNLLWALVAGLAGMDWRELSAAEKDRLRSALSQFDRR
jgi:DNA transformation protein and related proteins